MPHSLAAGRWLFAVFAAATTVLAGWMTGQWIVEDLASVAVTAYSPARATSHSPQFALRTVAIREPEGGCCIK
jgi:hypothetical protein